jgi:hypothetical protein
MRLKAYVLAADPNWIQASVLSYYNWIDEIVVSYDSAGLSWTGYPIPIKECLDKLVAIDPDHKMRFLAGNYHSKERTPLENDTYQRQCAVDYFGQRADWILQIDTDEVVPSATAIVECLKRVPADRMAVDWPMRAFFQRAGRRKFLEVTTFFRRQLSEYPGAIATRPGARLERARINSMPTWVCGIQRRPYNPLSDARLLADEVIPASFAILHLSWVRSPEDIQRKTRSWSHATDFNVDKYFSQVWAAAPRRWPFLYNFPPVWPKLWPALKPTSINDELIYPAVVPATNPSGES